MSSCSGYLCTYKWPLSLVILQIWLCRCNGLGTVCGCSLDIHVPEPCLQWGTAELMKPLWGGGGAWWEVHRSLGVPSSEGVLVSSHENLLKQGKAWSLNSCLVLHWDFFFCIPYAYAICHEAFAKGQWACWSWIQLLSMLPLAANLTQLKLPEKRVLIERLPDQTGLWVSLWEIVVIVNWCGRDYHYWQHHSNCMRKPVKCEPVNKPASRVLPWNSKLLLDYCLNLLSDGQ